MYIEFVCNLLLQSEASGEQVRLGELERDDRETWRRTGGGGEGEREGGMREADTKR